jgi:hypothetical protein
MYQQSQNTIKIEVKNSETFDSDEDLEAVAAIVSAATLLFSSAGASKTSVQTKQKKSVWKFSGYWWARPVPMVRARPY